MSLPLSDSTAVQNLTSSMWRPIQLCRKTCGDLTIQLLWKNGVVFAAKSTSSLTERVPLSGFPKEKITLSNLGRAAETLRNSILGWNGTFATWGGLPGYGGGGCTSKPQPEVPQKKVLDMVKLNEEMEGLNEEQLGELAMLYFGKGDIEAFVEINKKRLGPESRAMAIIYETLGKVYFDEKQYWVSIEWYNEAVKLAKTHTEPAVDIAALEAKKQEAYRLHCNQRIQQDFTFTPVKR